MDIQVIGTWNQDSNAEIYYDKTFRHYIIRNQLIIDINPFSNTITIPIKLEKGLHEIFLQKFLQFRICLVKNLMAIQTENLTFVCTT